MRYTTVLIVALALAATGCTQKKPATNAPKEPTSTPTPTVSPTPATKPGPTAATQPPSAAPTTTRPGKAPAALPAVVGGNTAFGLALLRQLAKDADKTGPPTSAERNVFFSPLNISMALAMAYAGARGETAKEMSDACRFPAPAGPLHDSLGFLLTDLQTKGTKAPWELAQANRVWAQRGFALEAGFQQILKRSYRAPVALADFARDPDKPRLAINAWVERKTKQRIKKLIPVGGVTKQTRYVIVSAIYFKGLWQTPFEKTMTRDAPFFLPGGKKVLTKTMNRTGRLRYAELPKLRLLELPYRGKRLSMLLVLPKQVDGLAEIVAALNVKTLKEWTARLVSRKVQVRLPRLKMTQQYQLATPLQALGMKKAFTPRAEFGGMSKRKPLFIGMIVHKAFVEVDEKGTEAAAATAIMASGGGMPQAPPLVAADRPFLFLLRDSKTGSVLFVGRIVNPNPTGTLSAGTPPKLRLTPRGPGGH